MAEAKGSVQAVRFESAALKGNLPGDPHLRDLWVYLPPGYERAHAPYPVLFCLSGFSGRGRMLLNDSAWEPGLADRMDRLIAAGKCLPMILALPDCFTHLGGSQYVNSPAMGRYEDYVLEELVPFVDRTFRTLAAREHRGVIGKSSGGYGAIVLGMRHADVFGAVACHSADMAFDWCYARDFGPALRAIRKAGGIAAWKDRFFASQRKKPKDFAALNLLAMAACYAPNVDAPPAYGDLPFDLETGAARPDVWKRWLEHDPLTLVERHVADLKRLRLLYLDCGTEDEWYLELGARQMTERLKALGVPHEYEEFEDGHMNIPYRYDVSLPRLSAALAG